MKTLLKVLFCSVLFSATVLAQTVVVGGGSGASFPLTSTTANPASTGAIRLAYTDLLVWRNATNAGDIPLSVDSGGVIHAPFGFQNDNPTNDLGVYPGGAVPVAPSAGSWHPFFDTTAGFSVRSNSAIKTLPNAYTSTAGKVIDTYNSTTGAITEKGTALSCLSLGATTSSTYAQATTYYNGRIGAASTTNTTPTALTVPRTGVIKSVCYGNYIGGTIDSGTNTGTVQLYKLNTTTALTDTAITPTFHTVFLPTAGSCVSGTLDTVTAGDTLLLQVITPATMGASATSVVTNATVCYDAT